MIEPVAFKLGTLEVRWYGVVIGTAIFLGTILSIKEAKDGVLARLMLDLYKGDPGSHHWRQIILCNLFLGLLYDNLLQILAFRSGGMAIHGAILEV